MSKLSTLLILLCSGVTSRGGAQELVAPAHRDHPMLIVGPVGSNVALGLRALRQSEVTGLRTRLVPLPPRHAEDPADSLYRLARRAMADENYRTAARLFLELVDNFPRSDYAGDALYYRAYALYQLGGQRSLADARRALDRQSEEYPRAGTREDAKTLLTRIQTEQARRGDADAAQKVVEKAKELTSEHGCASDDDDMRIAALQGLMQMDAESALPILRQVLAKRGSCTESLRKHAVFIVSQKHSDEATSLLLDVARGDPSVDVRGEAIQWLGQSHSTRAVSALDSIAATTNDDDILDKAIFALSQSHDERSMPRCDASRPTIANQFTRERRPSSDSASRIAIPKTCASSAIYSRAHEARRSRAASSKLWRRRTRRRGCDGS